MDESKRLNRCVDIFNLLAIMPSKISDMIAQIIMATIIFRYASGWYQERKMMTNPNTNLEYINAIGIFFKYSLTVANSLIALPEMLIYISKNH